MKACRGQPTKCNVSSVVIVLVLEADRLRETLDQALSQRSVATGTPARYIAKPRGMLGYKERPMLYGVAQRDSREKGGIVDAGAFMGSSAFCMVGCGAECACVQMKKGKSVYVVISKDSRYR
jgi:hypothetical protein